MTQNFVTDVVISLEYYHADCECHRKTSAGTLFLITSAIKCWLYHDSFYQN